MMKKIALMAGIMGLTGVALGAFGAHALKARLAATGYTSVWETAVVYHLLHAVALYACSQARSVGPWHQNRGIAWAWGVGVVLFSGSLYILALGGPAWLGPITPLGGLSLLLGWGLVIRQAFSPDPPNN